MDSPGLTITIGCPGSGKSTWADRNLPPETLRLERDRFREALFGSRRSYHEHPLDHKAKSVLVTKTMLEAMRVWPHKSWAATGTGIEYSSVKDFIYQALYSGPYPGGGLRFVIFERSRNYLETNNRIRPHEHRVPQEVLDDFIAKFDDPQAWWRGPHFKDVPTIYA